MARPAISAAVRTTSGAAMRQGPHQAAQKSIRTGTRASRMISSNSSTLTSTGSLIGGNADLQVATTGVCQMFGRYPVLSSADLATSNHHESHSLETWPILLCVVITGPGGEIMQR